MPLGREVWPRLKGAAAQLSAIVLSGTLGVTDQLRAPSGLHPTHYVPEKRMGLEQPRETVRRAIDDSAWRIGANPALAQLQMRRWAWRVIAEALSCLRE